MQTSCSTFSCFPFFLISTVWVAAVILLGTRQLYSRLPCVTRPDNVMFSIKIHLHSQTLHLFSGPPGGPPAGLNGGIPGNPPPGGNWKFGGTPPWGGGKGKPPGGGNGRPPALPGGGIGRGGVLLAPPGGAFMGSGKGGMEKLEPGRGGAVAVRI